MKIKLRVKQLMVDSVTITFRPSGRGKAQCDADPLFPQGKNPDISKGEISCLIDLPYPAPECGIHIIHCHACDLKIGVTAAGRADDPKSVRVPCKGRVLNA